MQILKRVGACLAVLAIYAVPLLQFDCLSFPWVG